ncbi:hypothetical protein HELRODRAFT_71557 [Helobdella robusta]|uniref:SUMO-activating enzyme subunit n=1 Tax=Helobdella robusta TaxID=6412 RepID=T1G0N3_HELRO|nr:hypothetical protein HELRODRAFT_71557 [Helobdella robusta]ESO11542.1 hypothetical protein HELRODRAFT_71557 [Helobdella robusta]
MAIIDEEKIKNSQILLVGAGGIGCELLKNLVLSGFRKIKIIDLDTIDISNLNRQFLFRKQHVGKSKAQVAKESALQLNPDIQVEAFHDSVMNSNYGVPFFKSFDIVLNALDNGAARSHVNRMCLASDVPLVESGTAGYLGQVSVIKKKLTGCYDCQPKPAQKTFPGCTIRNTPSEIIHCVVWAKHLFNQLFGESDPDQDVSPDTEDPEAAGMATQAVESSSKVGAIGGLERKSTRVWAEDTQYDSNKLFYKFFNDDIKYLLSMSNLWKKRTPPRFIDPSNLPFDQQQQQQSDENVLNDQKLWSLSECIAKFHESVHSLKNELKAGGPGSCLVWDKDSESAMDFVTCAANIRAYIFQIQGKSRFDIKSMAGNIIPAIATTNAVVAGLIVLQAFKVLSGKFEICKDVYINQIPNQKKKLLVPCSLEKPNPKCYVCSDKREVTLKVDVDNFTVKMLEEKVLKGPLGMVAPDVEIDDGKGTIMISSEEGETEDNWGKFLCDLGIQTGVRLKCDDFHQEYNIVVNILHCTELKDNVEFELVGDVSELQKDLRPASSSTSSSAVKQTGNGDAMENGGDVSTAKDGHEAISWLLSLFIHSFVHSFVRSFVRLF